MDPSVIAQNGSLPSHIWTFSTPETRASCQLSSSSSNPNSLTHRKKVAEISPVTATPRSKIVWLFLQSVIYRGMQAEKKEEALQVLRNMSPMHK